MKILVVGGGAREHALTWKLSQDRSLELQLLCAPGNPGTASIARNVPADVGDVHAMADLASRERVDLVVVGPEAPLVAGLADLCRERGIAVFGPSKEAAQLEGSKVFAKEFMSRNAIPTAGYRVFTDADEAERFVREQARPLVVKADGLAAGKGVVVAANVDEALLAIRSMMRERVFGAAGARVVIEERLDGAEVSYHVVSDGERYVLLATAQDHKRVFAGDRGPNTGGMGAYSPAPAVDIGTDSRIVREIIQPTLRGLAREGMPFQGVLFVGLMMTPSGPKVLEYNVRFGDPECETLVARWRGSILALLSGAARGDLGGVEASWEAPAALTVVLASAGYPASADKGRTIRGIDAASRIQGAFVFHAGTAFEGDCLVTAGGRVLAVTGLGRTIDHAADQAYRAVDLIQFDGMHFRRDIGWRARTR